MNLGLTLEIVILSRHGSVAPYVTLGLSCHYCADEAPSTSSFHLIALRLTCEILTMRATVYGTPARGKSPRSVRVERSKVAGSDRKAFRAAAIIDSNVSLERESLNRGTKISP